jgi:hypothetical protein
VISVIPMFILTLFLYLSRSGRIGFKV